MALKPAAQAKASFGDGPLEEAREYSWVGDGAFLMRNMFNKGQVVQLIAAAPSRPQSSRSCTKASLNT